MVATYYRSQIYLHGSNAGRPSRYTSNLTYAAALRKKDYIVNLTEASAPRTRCYPLIYARASH